jgi:hypothetical protein
MHDTSSVLRRLLDQGLAWHPEYGGGLANHLPMALHALHALGADGGRLRAFASSHAARLQRRSEVADDGFERRCAAVGAAISREGRDDVLRRELADLMTGVAASAFHGLIRVAHAVQAGHDGELAMGLAYWAHRLGPPVQGSPGPSPSAPVDMPYPEWLAALQALRSATAIEGRMITRRMRGWAAEPGFAALAPRLRIDDATWRDLSTTAAALYAASGNFTVLHMVTASHALRVLMPWIDDRSVALRHFSIAAAAALKAANASPGAAPPAHPWGDIVPLAIASDDEHVIKLVHAARDLERTLGGEVFCHAATRAVSHAEIAA